MLAIIQFITSIVKPTNAWRIRFPSAASARVDGGAVTGAAIIEKWQLVADPSKYVDDCAVCDGRHPSLAPETKGTRAPASAVRLDEEYLPPLFPGLPWRATGDREGERPDSHPPSVQVTLVEVLAHRARGTGARGCPPLTAHGACTGSVKTPSGHASP